MGFFIIECLIEMFFVWRTKDNPQRKEGAMIGLDFIECVADLARDEEDRNDVLAIISPCNPNTKEWKKLLQECKDECSKPYRGHSHRDECKAILLWLVSENGKRILFPKDLDGMVPVVNGDRWAKSEKEIVWKKSGG